MIVSNNLFTLAKFRTTGEEVSIEEGCARLGMDRSAYELTDNATSFLIYDDWLYIEVAPVLPGGHGLIIERDYFTGTRAQMEAQLYFGWYVTECVAHYTLDGLSDLLAEWCDWTGLPKNSADEILCDLVETEPRDRTPAQYRQIAWLEWFSRVWDETSDQEG